MGRRRFRNVIRATAGGALALAGVTGCLGGGGGGSTTSASSAAQPSPDGPTLHSTVAVRASGTAGSIGRDYIGLSYESSTLNFGDFKNAGNFAQLLRNLGPGVLRFGGDSADTGTFQGVSPGTLRALDGLLDAAGWSALYTVNLGHFDATTDGNDARTVASVLGSRLDALACGNEPDSFPYSGVRTRSFTESDYLAEESTCLSTVHAAAPKVPLEGPDTASKSQWLPDFAAREKGTVSWLGQHYYPLCASQDLHESPAQLTTQLISSATTEAEVSEFRWAAAAAKTAHASLHMTETNSGCNGGILNTSDTYATALWAVSYILTGAENGVAGMNFHGGIYNTCTGYTPLCRVSANEYQAEPVYYGMMFAHMLGPGRLLPVSVSSGAGAHVAAFALRPASGGGLRLMVENLGQDPTSTTLKVGKVTGAPTVTTLSGPSLTAVRQVTIGGQELAANGVLPAVKSTTVSGCSATACRVAIAPYSAALITFP